MTNNLSIVILAAGKGTRMKSGLPKVCHPIGGLPMLCHVIHTVEQLGPAQIITVIAPNTPDVNAIIPSHVSIAYQATQEGTGHAVMAGMVALRDPQSDILVVYGDTPLLTAQTLEQMLALRQRAHVVVMGMRAPLPHQYGRIFMDQDKPYAIIEAKDCSPEQLNNPVANSGVMLISGQYRQELLGKLTTDNAQGEYLLTDVIAHAYNMGLTTACFEGELDQLSGVNDRIDLARCEMVFQDRCRQAAMANGATLEDPKTTHFSYDTRIGQDVTIQPFVYFGPGVEIKNNASILGHSHVEGAIIGEGCTVGPFARIRPGTVLDDKAKVGNFVEIKKSHLKKGAKVNHLSYIGDAQVGEKANIGAGTITCNYDGYHKSQTVIGDGVFIGSNSALVAPVEIGAGAMVGAGSVITKSVSIDALAVARPQQQEIPMGALRFRNKRTEKAG